MSRLSQLVRTWWRPHCKVYKNKINYASSCEQLLVWRTQAVGGWYFCEQKMIRSVVRDDIRGCVCLHYLIRGVNWGEHTVILMLLRSAETWMITRTCAVMPTELTVLDFPEGSLFPSVRVCCVACGEAELRQTNGRARPTGLRRWPEGWGEAEMATSWPETCTLLGSLRARSEYWADSWHARQLLQGLVHLFKEGKQNRAAR